MTKKHKPKEAKETQPAVDGEMARELRAQMQAMRREIDGLKAQQGRRGVKKLDSRTGPKADKEIDAFLKEEFPESFFFASSPHIRIALFPSWSESRGRGLETKHRGLDIVFAPWKGVGAEIPHPEDNRRAKYEWGFVDLRHYPNVEIKDRTGKVIKMGDFPLETVIEAIERNKFCAEEETVFHADYAQAVLGAEYEEIRRRNEAVKRNQAALDRTRAARRKTTHLEEAGADTPDAAPEEEEVGVGAAAG